MRINNNLMAMNTHRQLSVNNTAGAKSIEKLSSGYRINRAGDDAAGLAISEKMRGQIRGLSQASKNAQDDISLIQTTEGALNETHAIIQRMREMAVQSANDTNTDDDRQALQNEMNQLASEVTRISNTTEFNTRKLLNGNLDKGNTNATGDLTFHIGANSDQNMKFSVKAMDAKSLGLAEDVKPEVSSGKFKTANGKEFTVTGTNANESLNGIKIEFAEDNDDDLEVQYDAASKTYKVKGDWDNSDGGHTPQVADLVQKINAVGTGPAKGNAIKLAGMVQGDFVGIENTTVTLEGGVTEAHSTVSTFATDGSVKEAVVAKGIDISTQEAANKAINRIDSALKRVSDQRAELGAVQNRLGHTIKNVDTAAENLQASESRIRDVDMAKEMMEFTKNNILQQASQAMLAQANQAPQGVLQLLR